MTLFGLFTETKTYADNIRFILVFTCSCNEFPFDDEQGRIASIKKYGVIETRFS